MQRLLFPRWEPGRELPATTLLPFLAAVGRCCCRDKTKPGTLLSHSRCCWIKKGLGGGGSGCPNPLTASAAGPHISSSPTWVMGQKDTLSHCSHLLTLP